MKEVPLKPFPHGKPFASDGEPESVLELLRRARLILAPRGAWRKGALKGPQGSRCLRQALADSDGKLVGAAEKVTMRAIQQGSEFGHYSSIPLFNDALSTQKHDVIAVLDRAIELAEKETK